MLIMLLALAESSLYRLAFGLRRRLCAMVRAGPESALECQARERPARPCTLGLAGGVAGGCAGLCMCIGAQCNPLSIQ